MFSDKLRIMYFAVIDTESLADPRIINDFPIFKVVIEYEPNSEANKYHHIFFIKIKSEEIDKKISKISQEMKNGWYAFFWDDQYLLIVYNNKTFKVTQKNPDYSAAQNYGRLVGIQGEFLDFKTYFDRYKKITL